MDFYIAINQGAPDGAPNLILEAIQEFEDAAGNTYHKRLRLDLEGALNDGEHKNGEVSVNLHGAYLEDMITFLQQVIELEDSAYTPTDDEWPGDLDTEDGPET